MQESTYKNIVKLIRSKGVGIFFVTQNPTDIPNGVLSQLGLKVQHALRAFTAIDRKAIKLTAENYPLSDYYKTDEALTSLGIGEALVTALSEKGNPTPLAATMLRAPFSRMDILTPDEIRTINESSVLVQKYSQVIDRESAYEILSGKVTAIQKEKERVGGEERGRKGDWEQKPKRTTSRRTPTPQDQMIKVLTSATFMRGVFGILKKVMK